MDAVIGDAGGEENVVGVGAGGGVDGCGVMLNCSIAHVRF